MKRDPRLRGLSSEHHHALVLARRTAAGSVTAAQVRAAFNEELAPHFAVEESLLLPALAAAGAAALVARTVEDHLSIRAALARAEAGEEGGLAEFAALLTEHVRFEERELFPACEALLPTDVLDRLTAPQPDG